MSMKVYTYICAYIYMYELFLHYTALITCESKYYQFNMYALTHIVKNKLRLTQKIS